MSNDSKLYECPQYIYIIPPRLLSIRELTYANGSKTLWIRLPEAGKSALSQTMTSVSAPPLPFPIYKPTAGVERYVLYDIDVISWLRKTHNLLGILIGTLPQIPSQNVFLGLPLQLQTEEARLLVEVGLAFFVDDVSRHERDYANRSPLAVQELKDSLLRERKEIARSMRDAKKARSEVASRKAEGQRNAKGDILNPAKDLDMEGKRMNEASNGMFEASEQKSTSEAPGRSDEDTWTITPSSCTEMLSGQATKRGSSIVPEADPSSYALFKHLHERGYFMTPGLRFGCQFSVYPGDPLRYHSHFLAVSANWNEEMDLLHLIGGGRLGTGVKKGWMIGGTEEHNRDDSSNESTSVSDKTAKVRTFCIEWGGM